MLKLALLAFSFALAFMPASAQDLVKTTILKHLKTSKDFTLKVAEAMPADSYDFKLTPKQMSFAEQVVHLSQGFDYFTSTFTGEKPNPPKPASMKKADVVAFVATAYDKMMVKVEALSHEQMAKSYKFEGKEDTGISLILGLLDHTTHHRASAEMYLRAKGVTPPEYEF